MKEWEIWVGLSGVRLMEDEGNLQKTPRLIGKEKGSRFEVACFVFELKRALKSIEYLEKKGQYVSQQDMGWFHREHNNSNWWDGKYYKSRLEALESFNEE